MVKGDLKWLDGGSKLDDAFLVFAPFFSGGPLLGYFSATEGFSDSGSQLYFIGGSDVSVLVAVKWLVATCVRRTEICNPASWWESQLLAGTSWLFLAVAGLTSNDSELDGVEPTPCSTLVVSEVHQSFASGEGAPLPLSLFFLLPFLLLSPFSSIQLLQ